jgi:hypothetical protein
MIKDHKSDFYICKIDSNKLTYYSYLAQCELDGYANITNHFSNMLLKKHTKKWLWIIDGNDYKILNGTIENYIELKLIKELIKILSIHSSTLENIIIINSSFSLKQLLAFIIPFLDNELKKKFIYN